jgi:CRISPR-associated protein Cmr4
MPDTRLYWLHTLSPTHVGVGRGVGYIDLPIDRDQVTGWPIIRGSAFKGVWADHHRATKEARETNPLLKAAFGIAGDDNNSNAGALIPTDAKIVCLPVRSFRGTFAWATSPLVLKTLKRTLELAGEQGLPDVPTPDGVRAFHASDTALTEEVAAAPQGGRHRQEHRIYLEDLDFSAFPNENAHAWAEWIARKVFDGDNVWSTEFQRRFVILPDNVFDFLCESGTEVHTRVRIKDDTKTVAKGALWMEESLPAETILVGVIQCDRIFGRNGEDITSKGLLEQFARESLSLQIGGKATVGRGQVRCVFTEVK